MWLDRTFADALAWGASVHGEREAVVHGESRITFAELARRADQFAAGLLELGVRPGDKFGIWLPDCVEWLVARWAVPSIGAILVPINTRFRDVDLGYILKQSDCKGLLLSARWHAVDYLAVLRDVVPDLDAQRPGNWAVDSLPELRFVVCTDDTVPPGMLAYTEVVERGARGHGSVSALQQARSAIRPEDIAQILFTSGTTSFPKGAMVRHGALLQNNFNTIARLNLGMTDRYLATSPLFSATGTSFTLSPYLAGGCSILMDRFSGEAFCRIVEAERVTMSFFVEAMVHDIKAYAARDRYDLSSLRTGTGAPLTPESFRWLVEELGCRDLTNTYGMSESSNAICRSFYNDPLEQRIESSGRPMPGLSLRIDSLVDGRPLNPGEVGEIRVKGYTVTAGYYKMPK
ncbi:MAG: AMP-binding protein [Betaproteobacteria bacterium]|nr:AMP-binding protein [Betaproteobacteria bacterium]